MMTKSLTILRISWFGCFASLAMLIAGSALACIYASSLWLLVVPPTAFAGLLLGLGISEIDRKRKPDEHELRGMFLLVMYGFLGLGVLWLGGHSTILLIAAAMLMASSFWFFTGFVVRGSSEGTNDTLDLVALALGLAAVVACRQCLGLVWWESLLPLILSAGVPGYIRTCWPRRDLPPALRSREARRRVVEVTPPLLDYK